jgi:chemotaxis response regulator CheB
MIRVLVAEDQNLIRGALVVLLTLEPDISVVAETARGDTILAEVDNSQPDVAVLDVEPPAMDGINAAERLKQAGSPVRVLMLTSVGTPGNFDRAMGAGPARLVPRDAQGASGRGPEQDQYHLGHRCRVHGPRQRLAVDGRPSRTRSGHAFRAARNPGGGPARVPPSARHHPVLPVHLR